MSYLNPFDGELLPNPPAAALMASNALSRLIAASATPVTFCGLAGAASQTAATATIPGRTLLANSILEIDVMFNFDTAKAGRVVVMSIGGQTIGQSFPTATMLSIAVKVICYVLPDLTGLYVQSINMNNVVSPSASLSGAPFSTLTSGTTLVTVDLTADQTFLITNRPVSNDVATLSGFSVVNHGFPTAVNYAPSTAVACWGDSLTALTGSTGNFILTPTGNTLSGTNTILAANTIAGLLPGQIITGTGIPVGTIILSASGTTITMSQNATATNNTVALTVIAGSYPQQLMYSLPARAVAQLGIAGQTSAQITTRVLADVIRGKYWIPIYDMGRNDVGNVNLTTIVMANLATCVANLAAGTKYVINTIIPAANEGPATGNWNAIVALNNAIVTLYTTHVSDVFAALTANGTVNIPLKYRNCVTTTGTITSGTNTMTVASATSIVNGMYCISPGSTAISDGSLATAPTITISGTTVTLSGNATSSLTSAMVSFISPSEVHLNDLGLNTKMLTDKTTLLAQ